MLAAKSSMRTNHLYVPAKTLGWKTTSPLAQIISFIWKWHGHLYCGNMGNLLADQEIAHEHV